MKYYSLLLSIVLTLSVMACSDEKETGPRINESELTLTLHEDTWTYVSLERGIVIAEVAFDDTDTQQALDQRSDWDIAYAPGGLMRTNSAAGSPAKVAIGASSETLENIDLLQPFSDLTTDLSEVEIW